MRIPIKTVGLTVNENKSHNFSGYGMYIKGSGKVNDETRKELEEKIFVKLGARVIHQTFEMCYPRWNPKYNNYKPGEDHLDPYNTEALDAWIEEHIEKLGYGGREFTADMKKYGAVYAMNMCCIQEHHLSDKTVAQHYVGASEETLAVIRGNGSDSTIVNDGVHPIDDDYIPTYVDTAVNLVERMIKAFDMPVKYITVYDEPNFGVITPHQMCRILKLTREKLDKKGLCDVRINGPATAGINLAYAKAIYEIDREAFELIDKITIHSFGTGMMDTIHRTQAQELGKELWITSTGAEGDDDFMKLPINEKGERYDNSAIYGVVNASAVLVDVNLGASYMGDWAALQDFSVFRPGKQQYYMFLVDKTENYSYFGKELLVTQFYKYISTIIAAISNNSEIYYCESDEEGSMTERLNMVNAINNQMAALVGKNEDGKWGIAILNKTDTETRLKELASLYENTKHHNLAGHSVYLDVELDIKPLYGTGKKEFKVMRTGKNCKYMENDGTVVIENGRGIVRVAPFELAALREI